MLKTKQPIFQSIFGAKWQHLPRVFQHHYAIRADSNDKIVAKGTISVEYSWLIYLYRPFLSVLKILPPWRAKEIPIQVIFSSTKNAFCFVRTFEYPKHQFEFNSKVIPIKDNLVVEITRWNFGWKCRYAYENGQVVLKHEAYVLKIFSWYLPLPVGLFLGRCDAFEVPVSDTVFKMRVQFRHFIFGITYQYFGTFEMVSKADDNS